LRLGAEVLAASGKTTVGSSAAEWVSDSRDPFVPRGMAFAPDSMQEIRHYGDIDD
jgi:hypothetical protein